MEHPMLEEVFCQDYRGLDSSYRRVLHGYVLKSDGRSLSGVTVRVLKGRVIKGTATTDRGGYWEILDLEEGTYKVTASMAGYASQIKRATIGANTVTKVTFTMTPLNRAGYFKNKRKNVVRSPGAF